MKRIDTALILAVVIVLSACTTTKQHSASGFRPPEGNYKLVVMRPDVKVSLLTAGGLFEPREDWTNQARANVLEALRKQQSNRGGSVTIAATANEAGADPALVRDLDRLHEVVGRAIQLHKYTPGLALPTKKEAFDWTLGSQAVEYGRASGHDYALFLYAEDSFSSGGRVALQAVSMLGCVVGVCIMPAGGRQIAFASLVDLKSGNVVWYNFLFSEDGDIREPAGAEKLVDILLKNMKANEPSQKS